MSSPSLIPVSTQQSSLQQSQRSGTNLLLFLRPFLTRISALYRHALSNSRPWTELIDRTAFTRPTSLTNAAYFSVNYLIIFFYGRRSSEQSLVIAILVTSVLSLLLTAVMVRVGIICVHRAFRDPDDLFLEETQPLGSGIISIFGGPLLLEGRCQA
ncbi:hypothetical protein EV2_006067 [Malus domestica]|nr:PRA1 family protein B2-like [Malus domestica]